MRIIVGSRGSKLALQQTEEVIKKLKEKFPKINFEIKVIKTSGDKLTAKPLFQLVQERQVTKGLFVKEIEEALLDNKIDFAVHSLKDLPSELAQGLCISAVTKRIFPFDIIIHKDPKIKSIAALPHKAKVGTSSLRRKFQLQQIRADLNFCNLRGNLDTRIKKLFSQDLDALVVAEAGLKRLGTKINYFRLPLKVCIPAVGQGALAIETKKNNSRLKAILRSINDKSTFQLIEAERAFLKEMGGGCQVPLAAFSEKNNKNKLKIWGMLYDDKIKAVIRESLTGNLSKAEKMGRNLAQSLLKKVKFSIMRKY